MAECLRRVDVRERVRLVRVQTEQQVLLAGRRYVVSTCGGHTGKSDRMRAHAEGWGWTRGRLRCNAELVYMDEAMAETGKWRVGRSR